MADNYANWRKRLAGEKVPAFLQPQIEDCGYYRMPITEKAANGSGRNVITGWIPVAFYVDQFLPTVLRGLVGAGEDMRDMKDDEVAGESFWSWCCRHPISYEVYQAVAENGKPWPDMQLAAEKHQMLSDNAGPPAEVKEKTIDDYHTEIRVLVDRVSNGISIKNDGEAAIWLGTKNRLAEARLAADKAGKAVYEPPYRLYKTAFAQWTPMVKAAEQGESRINTALLTYRETERRRLAAVQADAEQAQREEEERNARAADRAIARGEPELAPEVTTEEAPPETAAALTPVAPTYGTRKLKEELKTFVTIADPVKVATYFAQAPELMAVLQILAERAVKRGESVPGITTREGLV